MENEKSRSAWAAMKYSIIIPVYNRPDEVDELLESLTRQTVKDFEVVVVEDGSTVPCKEVVEKYRAVDSSQFTVDSSHADEEKLSTVNSQLSTINSQLKKYDYHDWTTNRLWRPRNCTEIGREIQLYALRQGTAVDCSPREWFFGAFL